MYRIENKDRPGYYWSSKYSKFCSEFGKDYKIYQTYNAARRTAEKLSRIYGVIVQEYSQQQRAFETANGMHKFASSAASKKNPSRAQQSASDLPSLDSAIYQERVKWPRWNVKVGPLMDAAVGGKLLRMRLPSFTKQDHENAARQHITLSQKKDKDWAKLINKTHLATFGVKRDFTDYKISGIGRDEYPEAAKNKLRRLAHESTAHYAAADAHWKAAGHRNHVVNYKFTANPSTSTEVRSPTSTATHAKTTGNITVTGGAGAGATSVTIRKNPSRPNPAHLKAQERFYSKRNPLPYPSIKRKVVTRPIFSFKIKTADGWKDVQGTVHGILAAKATARKLAAHYRKPIKVFSNAA